MKKLILTTAVAIAAFISNGVAGDLNKKEVPAEKKQVASVTYTYSEMQAKYGNNITLQEGTFSAADEIIFTHMDMSVPNCTGEPPCDAAVRSATAKVQHIANQCCCDVKTGVECCTDGGLIAILFIVSPNVTCP